MTANEFIKVLKELEQIRGVFAADRFLLPAGKLLEAELKNRVFNEGKDSNNAKIASSYSSNPTKYKKEQFVKKSAFKPNTLIGTRSGFSNFGGFKSGKRKKTKGGSQQNNSQITNNFSQINSGGWGAGRKRSSTSNRDKGIKKVPAMFLKNGYRQFRQVQGRQVAYVDLSLSGSLQKSIQTAIQGDTVTVGIVSQAEAKKRYILERAIYRKPIFRPPLPELQKAEKEMVKQIELFINSLA